MKQEPFSIPAPIPNTIDDFWLMVWGEETRVIAMVTSMSQGKKLNFNLNASTTECSSSAFENTPDSAIKTMSEQYWPANVGETMNLTKFYLETVDVKENPDFVVSTVKLRHLKVRAIKS
jgi:protein tyrosine phosphatase